MIRVLVHNYELFLLLPSSLSLVLLLFTTISKTDTRHCNSRVVVLIPVMAVVIIMILAVIVIIMAVVIVLVVSIVMTMLMV